MGDHRYAAGEFVAYQPSGGRAAPGVYRIVRTVPADQSGEVHYRIKSDDEGHERIAGEDQLRRVRVDSPPVPAEAARRPLSILPPTRRPRAGR